MDPDLTQGLISEIVLKIEEMTDQGLSPCLVTTSDLRLASEIPGTELSPTLHFCLSGNSL